VSKERCQELIRRLRSYESSAAGYTNELTLAQAQNESLQVLLAHAEGTLEIFDETDIQLHAVAALELDRIEADLIPFAEARVFRKPTYCASKAIPAERDLSAYLDQRVCWHVGTLDLKHPKDWTKRASAIDLLEVIDKLKVWEGKTWRQIEEDCEQNHDWENYDQWENGSQRRLEELELDDRSGWYQVETAKMGRLFGFRDGNIMSVVWWDRDHEVYITHRRRKSQR